MDPVAFYFIGGLLAGVFGSFIAARLMHVDRLWALPSKPQPQSLIKPLTQAASVYALTGPAGLVALASNADHPFMRSALRLIIEGRTPDNLRETLQKKAHATHEFDRRCQFLGRLLAQLAPVLGIAGMAGAMYIGLSRLSDPTGSAAGLAVAAAMLMVGGNLIAMFSRRLAKPAPTATAAGLVATTMIIEAAAMIREGATAKAVEQRLSTLTGEEQPLVSQSKAA